MATGAPTTQTPPPQVARSTGTLIAAAALAVVVLGAGVGIGLKVLGGSATETLPPATETAAPVELPPPPVAKTAAVEAPAAPAPSVAPQVVLPPPSAAPPPTLPVASVAPIPKQIRPPTVVPVYPGRPKPAGVPASGNTDVGF